MRRIIGFEGELPSRAGVSWGGVAVQEPDGSVVNAVTGRKIPAEEFEQLAEAGQVTKLSSIKLDDDKAPLLLVVYFKDSTLAKNLYIQPGKLAGLVKSGSIDQLKYYVFDSRAAFRIYAEKVVDSVLESILYRNCSDDVRKDYVRLGMALAPGHSDLNALWVYLSRNNFDVARKVAEAGLADDESRIRFESVLSALMRSNERYELNYEDGVAEGGGIDIDVAASTFSNLLRIHRKLQPTISREYAYLNKDTPSPRFTELKAASAHFTFEANLKDRPLGERLARALELIALEKALRGELPEDLKDDAALLGAINSIVSPSDDTHVSQTPLGSDEQETVQDIEPYESEVHMATVNNLLAFSSGLSNVGQRVEFIIFGRGRKIRVSTVDDGEGNAPHGTECLREQSGIYTPMLISLVRKSSFGGRRVAYYLRSVRPIQSGDRISSLPSSIVRDAFLIQADIEVIETHPGAFRINSVQMVASSGSLDNALSWMDGYATQCEQFELSRVSEDSATWVLPPALRSPLMLARVTCELLESDGSMSVHQMVKNLQEKGVQRLRVNNARRLLYQYPRFLELDQADDQIIRLTENGRLFAQGHNEIVSEFSNNARDQQRAIEN